MPVMSARPPISSAFESTLLSSDILAKIHTTTYKHACFKSKNFCNYSHNETETQLIKKKKRATLVPVFT